MSDDRIIHHVVTTVECILARLQQRRQLLLAPASTICWYGTCKLEGLLKQCRSVWHEQLLQAVATVWLGTNSCQKALQLPVAAPAPT
jgi:hypothetical protein